MHIQSHQVFRRTKLFLSDRLPPALHVVVVWGQQADTLGLLSAVVSVLVPHAGHLAEFWHLWVSDHVWHSHTDAAQPLPPSAGVAAPHLHIQATFLLLGNQPVSTAFRTANLVKQVGKMFICLVWTVTQPLEHCSSLLCSFTLGTSEVSLTWCHRINFVSFI